MRFISSFCVSDGHPGWVFLRPSRKDSNNNCCGCRKKSVFILSEAWKDSRTEISYKLLAIPECPIINFLAFFFFHTTRLTTTRELARKVIDVNRKCIKAIWVWKFHVIIHYLSLQYYIPLWKLTVVSVAITRACRRHSCCRE